MCTFKNTQDLVGIVVLYVAGAPCSQTVLNSPSIHNQQQVWKYGDASFCQTCSAPTHPLPVPTSTRYKRRATASMVQIRRIHSRVCGIEG
jgi:hypothetical protein